MRDIKSVARISLIAALAITGGVAALPNRAAAAPLPMTCTQLPAKLLGGNIKYANAQLVPANTAPAAQPNNFTGRAPSTAKVPVSYCLVVLSYSSTAPNDIRANVATPARPPCTSPRLTVVTAAM